MNLQGKPPVWVGFHSLYASLHMGLSLFFILNETRLKKTVLGFNDLILRQILTEIDHFQLIASFQHARFQIASFKNGLGR